MTIQLDILTLIEQGEKLKQQGIQRAVDTANKLSPGWSDRAYDLFLTYLQSLKSGQQFKIESFRLDCEINDLIEKPHHKRAYGFISLKAAKNKLIKRAGYTTTVDPSSHGTPCSLWEKM